MKKHTLLILLYSISITCFGAVYAQQQLRITFPKTTISIVPPVNFELTGHFDGLLNKSAVSSIITKVEEGKGYLVYNNRFNKEYFKSIGLQLLNQETVKTKEMEGTLYLVSFVVKETNMHRYLLVTGDLTTTYLVMGNYPVGFKAKVSESIKRSLMTVQYK